MAGLSTVFPRDESSVLQRALLNWRRSADQVRGPLHLPGLAPRLPPASSVPHSLALTRLRLQGYTGSRIKVGDYLYYGQGTVASVEGAAQEYRAAADANNAEVIG